MTTPPSILNLAHKLLDVKAGESVADVCCGSGTYMVSAALEESRASYHGFEINVANRAAALMRAELIDVDMEVTLCDVLLWLIVTPCQSSTKFSPIILSD